MSAMSDRDYAGRYRDSRATLWVGDIDISETEEFFAQALTMMEVPFKYVKLIRDESGSPKGFGFICFQDEQSAMRFLNAYNGQPIPNSEVNKCWRLNTAGRNGNRQRPASAQSFHPRPDRFQSERENTIFVGSLSPEVTDEMLLDAFRTRYPTAYSAKVIKDRDEDPGKSKGYGFVMFRHRDDQHRAIKDGKENPPIVGHTQLRVSAAVNRSGQPRRRYPSTAASYTGEESGDGVASPPSAVQMYRNVYPQQSESSQTPMAYPDVPPVLGYPTMHYNAQGFYYAAPDFQQWSAMAGGDPNVLFQYQQQMLAQQQLFQQQFPENQWHFEALQQQQLSRGQSPMAAVGLVNQEQQQHNFHATVTPSAALDPHSQLCNQPDISNQVQANHFPTLQQMHYFNQANMV